MPKLRLVNIALEGVDYYHVVLDHDLLFDSEGVWTQKLKLDLDLRHVSYGRLLFDINARDTWNDRFDRKHVPEITEQIEDVYNRYKHQIIHELSQPKKLRLPSARSIYARNF